MTSVLNDDTESVVRVCRALHFNRKKLRRLLSITDSESFFVMTWAISALQSGRHELSRKYILFPSEAVTEQIDSRYFVHPWKMETLLNECLSTRKVIHLPNHPNRRLNCQSFQAMAYLCNVLTALEDAEVGIMLRKNSVFLELHRVAQRQFEWQRGFLSIPQLYRSIFLYGGKLCREFFLEDNGVGLDEFSRACIALQALFRNSPFIKNNISLDDVGVSSKVFQKSLGIIAVGLEGAIKKSEHIRSGIGHVAYKPSVFREYPCILSSTVSGLVFSPLPDLIALRATSGLFYDFAKADGNVRNEIASRFEMYSSDLIRKMLPSYQVKESYRYGSKKTQFESPDMILRRGEDDLIIFECKATRMSYQAKFSENPMSAAHKSYSEIAKGVFQIWRFVSHHRRKVGVSGKLGIDVRGVLLTLDAWLSMANGIQEEVINLAKKISENHDPDVIDEDQIPIVFCTISDLEQTLMAATEVSFVQTVQRATSEEFRGWQLWNVHNQLFSGANASRDYPFQDSLEEILPWWKEFKRRKAASPPK
ncbi:hypothetical protein ABMY26_15725 [Azospirillum sp. HJ39]|uniref:hypothetical protein n=1 Tax=Azospirillum sp. HJ39 TaxID=3159496 RepID=UPI0035565E19